jgi:hypothetical protein
MVGALVGCSNEISDPSESESESSQSGGTESGESSTDTASEVLPAEVLVILSGDEQIGVVGTPLAHPLRVEARDREGRGVPGVAIAWESAEGAIVPSMVVTGPGGIADAMVTLGTTSGVYTFDATIAEVSESEHAVSSVRFQAWADPDRAVSVIGIGGDGQRGEPGRFLDDLLEVEAQDAYGNPVPEAVVVWSANNGGYIWSGTLTDEAGRAAVAARLGPSAGWYTFTARVDEDEVAFDAMAPPWIASLALEPASPTTDVDLTVVVEPGDVEGWTYTYQWLLNGEDALDFDEPTVASEHTHKGQTWSVVVTPEIDGIVGEPAISGTVVIENSPPSLLGVALNDAAPNPFGILVAEPYGYVDIDGDAAGPFTYAWSWRPADSETWLDLPESSDTLELLHFPEPGELRSFREGDVIRVVVTPFDEDGAAGKPVEADDVAIIAGPGITFESTLKPLNPGASDQFGHMVRISADGSTLVVAAPYEDGSGQGANPVPNELASDAGAAYVFVRNADGAWEQQAYLKAQNSAAGARLGWWVSASADGDTVAVVATAESTGAGSSGAAYIFVREDDVWTQQAFLKTSNRATNDFMQSAALSDSGDVLAIGVINQDTTASDSGAVYVFERTDTSWDQTAFLKAPNAGVQHRLGQSIAISGDGGTIVAGARGEESCATGAGGDWTNKSCAHSGAAFVFGPDEPLHADSRVGRSLVGPSRWFILWMDSSRRA